MDFTLPSLFIALFGSILFVIGSLLAIIQYYNDYNHESV